MLKGGGSRGYGSKARRGNTTANPFFSNVFSGSLLEALKSESEDGNLQNFKSSKTLPATLVSKNDVVAKEPMDGSKTLGLAHPMSLAYRPKPALSSNPQTLKNLRKLSHSDSHPLAESLAESRAGVALKTLSQACVPAKQPSRRAASPRTAPTLQSDKATSKPEIKKRSSHTPKPASSIPAKSKLPLKSLAEQTRYISSVFPLIEHAENRCIKSYTDFTTFIQQHGTAKKIAEAGFGEVFQITIAPPTADGASAVAPPEDSVFKILPLRRQTLDAKTKSKLTKEQKLLYEKQLSEHTALKDALSEVKILIHLSSIVGFVDFKEIHVLRGRANSYWSDIWNEFQGKADEKSEFPDPSDADGWADDQLFLAIEMVYAGEPLSKLLPKLNTVWTVWDVLWGVLLAIGRAEALYEFEHRDLHVGNLCIKSGMDAEQAWDALPVRDYTKDLGFTELEVTILDYGLSRIKLPEPCFSRASKTDVIYNKLDEDIFDGNSADSRQYAIYRCMRSVLYFDDPNADYESRISEVGRSRRTWRGFYPLTTVVWLCFLVEKLEKHIRWPSKSAENEAYNMQNVKILAREEREFARRKMFEVERRLKRIFDMLRVGKVPSEEAYSTASIVDWAEREGWISDPVVSFSSSLGEMSSSGEFSEVYSDGS